MIMDAHEYDDGTFCDLSKDFHDIEGELVKAEQQIAALFRALDNAERVIDSLHEELEDRIEDLGDRTEAARFLYTAICSSADDKTVDEIVQKWPWLVD